MAPSKRQPSSTPRTSQAKKPKTGPAADTRLKPVIQALQKAEGLPKEVRSLLVTVLPHSLGVPHGDRAPCQHTVVGMAATALGGIEAEILGRIAEAESKAAGADAEKAALSAAKGAADAALEAKAGLVAERQRALDESAEALTRAAAAEQEAEAALHGADDEVKAAEAQKERVELAQRDVLGPVRDGSAEASQVPGLVGSLLALGRELALDDSLMASLTSSLSKEPASRGEFDNMVLDQFGEDLKQRAAALAEKVAGAGPMKEQRAEAARAAKAARVAAAEGRQACEEALGALRAEQGECEAAVRSAAAALTSFEKESIRAGFALEKDRARLEAFRELSLAAFRELEAPQAAAAEAPQFAEEEGQQATQLEEGEPVAAADLQAKVAEGAAAVVSEQAAATMGA